MSQKAWSAKRERQYAHVKESLLDQGKPRPPAEEIAARVANKERARHGESVDQGAARGGPAAMAAAATWRWWAARRQLAPTA